MDVENEEEEEMDRHEVLVSGVVLAAKKTASVDAWLVSGCGSLNVLILALASSS